MSSKPAPVALEPFPYDDAPLTPATIDDAPARESRARAEAHAAGLAEGRALAQQHLEQLRLALADTIRAFELERQNYYQRVEEEVVQLAFSIARKILHRESQLDPMILAGIARVTLDKLHAATQVRIRVHPHHATDWRHFFSSRAETHGVLDVVEDPSLSLEQCVLETSVGRTELGLEIQLNEIENGLSDLLALRPRSQP